MTVVRRIVNSLTDQELLQIIADHKRFEKDGFIGDCLMRSTAQRIFESFGGNAGSVVLWMEAVANAAYRNFAERYIREMDNGK